MMMRGEVLLVLLSGLAAQILAVSSNRDHEVFRGQCVRAVTELLQFTDELSFNIDWIFYISGYFDADWYKPKKQVLDTLLDSKIPYAIPAQTKELRDNAAYDLCTNIFSGGDAPWRPKTEPRYRYLEVGPYSALGLCHYSQLNARLKPYDVIGGDYVTMINTCSAHLEALLKAMAQKDIDVDALLVRYLGFNPYFSYAKWCTLGLNFALNRTRQARAASDEQGGSVVFDLKIRLPVLTREGEKDLLSGYYEAKEVNPWSAPSGDRGSTGTSSE